MMAHKVQLQQLLVVIRQLFPTKLQRYREANDIVFHLFKKKLFCSTLPRLFKMILIVAAAKKFHSRNLVILKTR